MYLGTRLNKFEVSDWQGKIPGSKQKWWECFVEDLSVELMEGKEYHKISWYPNVFKYWPLS